MNDGVPEFPELRLYLGFETMSTRFVVTAGYSLLLLGLVIWLVFLILKTQVSDQWGFELFLGLLVIVCWYFVVRKVIRGFWKHDNYLQLSQNGLKCVNFGIGTFWAWNEINGFSEIRARQHLVGIWVHLKGSKVQVPPSFRLPPPTQLEPYVVEGQADSRLRHVLNQWLEHYGAPELEFLKTHDQNAQWFRLGDRINQLFGIPSNDGDKFNG